MNNLILLVALLFGSQGASALMLDSMPVLVGIDKRAESTPSPQLISDNDARACALYFNEQCMGRLNASDIPSDGAAQLLTQRYWPLISEKQGRTFA